jgi:hypothetical protein
MNRIDDIQAKQRAVYNAHARTVEVETRDSGWRASDLAAADVGLMEAIGAYEAAFDCQPEYGEETGLARCGKYPLFNATPERIMVICGKE